MEVGEEGDGLARGGACTGGVGESMVDKGLPLPSDQALEPTNPHANTQPRGERATRARPDSGNASMMFCTVLETTKERRVARCRNTRSDEEEDVR